MHPKKHLEIKLTFRFSASLALKITQAAVGLYDSNLALPYRVGWLGDAWLRRGDKICNHFDIFSNKY